MEREERDQIMILIQVSQNGCVWKIKEFLPGEFDKVKKNALSTSDKRSKKVKDKGAHKNSNTKEE